MSSPSKSAMCSLVHWLSPVNQGPTSSTMAIDDIPFQTSTDNDHNNTEVCAVSSYPSLAKRLKIRSFQPAWQEKFDWVEYEQSKNAIFCKSCRWFHMSGKHWRTKQVRMTYVREGFTQFKYARQKSYGLTQHEPLNCARNIMFRREIVFILKVAQNLPSEHHDSKAA